MSGIPHQNVDAARGVFVDTSCITPLPSSQLLNHYGVQHDPHCLDNLIRNKDNNPDYWHKFTVSNDSCSKYQKNFVLKVICDFVYPSELLPVYVSQKATKIYFLARNCLEAILKLCKAGLTVPNPNKQESPFIIVIIKDVLTLQHIPIVTVQPNLLEVLKKRFTSGVLDLSRFHDDKDLHEFFLLSQPKLLLYILSLIPIAIKSKGVNTAASKVLTIILSHNDIKHLPNFDSLSVRSFNAIDLSHNKIQNIEDLVPLKDFPKLVDVNLDGNPLCCRFDSGSTYFLYVKSICRTLMTLDNRRLVQCGFYKKQKAFLCDTKGFNFANQFLQQYFIYYDELNRPNIDSFYDENAMFSLSYRDNLSHLWQSEDNRVASEYRTRSSNFLNPLNLNQSAPNAYPLFLGKDEVLRQIRSLPVTRHARYGFHVDLMAYSKTQAIIHVTGVFKSIFLTFGFTRTFVLSSQDSREWVITNDQLCANAPYCNTAGLITWPRQIPPSLFPDPTCYPKNMDAVASTFEAITGMAYEHSRKFLDKNNWSLELALKVFIDEHINDEIPDEAFNDSTNQAQEESDDDSVIITEDDILPPIESLIIDTHKECVQSLGRQVEPNNTQNVSASEYQRQVPKQYATKVVNQTQTTLAAPPQKQPGRRNRRNKKNKLNSNVQTTIVPSPLLPTPPPNNAVLLSGPSNTGLLPTSSRISLGPTPNTTLMLATSNKNSLPTPNQPALVTGAQCSVTARKKQRSRKRGLRIRKAQNAILANWKSLISTHIRNQDIENSAKQVPNVAPSKETM